MTKEKTKMKKLWWLLVNEEGQDLVEYTLLIVLLALAATGSLGVLATAINGVFGKAANAMNTTT